MSAFDRSFAPSVVRAVNCAEAFMALAKVPAYSELSGKAQESFTQNLDHYLQARLSHGLYTPAEFSDEVMKLVELRKRARREQALERKRLREARQAELEDQVYN